MTESKTDIAILTEEQGLDAVATRQQDARLHLMDLSRQVLVSVPDPIAAIGVSLNDIPALCQTVRALRAENERLINECERWKRRATAQTVRNGEMLSDFTKALKKL